MTVTKINAVSRASLKIKDVFYTFEFGAEVSVEPKDDIEKVKEDLWSECHSEVDKQIADVVASTKKSNE